jgi:hypothetical protein
MPSLRYSFGHPAICNGVVFPPLTAPMPVGPLSPINARNNPIPHADAIFRDTGMILTSPASRGGSRSACVLKKFNPRLLTLAHADK